MKWLCEASAIVTWCVLWALVGTGCGYQARKGSADAATKNAVWIQSNINPVEFASLQRGMTIDQLVLALGKLPEEFPQAAQATSPHNISGIITHSDIRYGWLVIDHPAFPEPFPFSVTVDLRDRIVDSITQPYSEPVSNTNLPAPKLTAPEEQSNLDDFPSIVDFRWKPCFASGHVTYELEIWSFAFSDPERWRQRSPRNAQVSDDLIIRARLTSAVPWCAYVLPGANDYIWRVRARAGDHDGPWSEFRAISPSR